MANDHFAQLESPYLDAEVLPARLPTEPEWLDEAEAFQGMAELEAAYEIDEEADQEAALEAWSSDLETETDQLIGQAETAADEVEELADETGGHVYEDFEGIEELEDTAEDRSEVRETVDEESDQPVQWREEEADEEAVEGEAEESLLETGELEEDGELEEFEEEVVGPQRGRGGPTTATETVTVLLDEPLEADDRYRLVSGDGKYAKTLSAKDTKPLVDGARLLSFTGIDPGKEYGLTHIRAAGAERVILPMNPFTALTEAGGRALPAKHTYITMNSQVPTKLPDAHRTDALVEPILVAKSSVLVDLTADDPNPRF